MIGVRRPRKKYRSAFTLMEMIVVMALFLIFTTLITAIYLQTTRFGRQVVLRAKTQEQVRTALESIARAIRVSDINYSSYITNGEPGTLPAQPMDYLKLINPAEMNYSNLPPSWSIRLEKNQGVCQPMSGLAPCIILSIQSLDLAALTPPGTIAEDLRFYVSPSKDPFAFNSAAGTYPSDQQPIVTVYMRVRGLAARESDQWTMSLQTTVTPRLYLR